MELLLNWLCIQYLHDLGKVKRDFLLLKRLKLEEFSIYSLLRQPVQEIKYLTLLFREKALHVRVKLNSTSMNKWLNLLFHTTSYISLEETMLQTYTERWVNLAVSLGPALVSSSRDVGIRATSLSSTIL